MPPRELGGIFLGRGGKAGLVEQRGRLLANLALRPSVKRAKEFRTRELLAVSQDGKREVMVKLDFPSFQPICMDWLPDGRLLIVSSGEQS